MFLYIHRNFLKKKKDVHPPMAEPRILALPFRTPESAFPRYCEGAGVSLTLVYVVQDVAQDPEDGPPDKF